MPGRASPLRRDSTSVGNGWTLGEPSRIACYYEDVPPFDDAGRVHAREWTVSTFGLLYDTYNAPLRTAATEFRNNAPATAPDVLTAPAESEPELILL